MRLTRDNNDPNLGARYVSVLLSSHVIDPVGLSSAAWIPSQVSVPRHTAVTRHKEGSISTALCRLVPHLHVPSKSTGRKSWGGGRRRRHKNTETSEREGDKDRVRRRYELIVLHQGQGSNAKVSPQIKTLWQQLSSHQRCCLCSRAYITTWLQRQTEGKDNFPLRQWMHTTEYWTGWRRRKTFLQTSN